MDKKDGTVLRHIRESITSSVELIDERISMIIMMLHKEHQIKELLDWFFIVANKNIGRQKMIPDKNVSSLGSVLYY